MKINVRNLVYIYKGGVSKRYGTIPKQVTVPYRINLGSGTITCAVKNVEGRTWWAALSAEKFDIFTGDSAAAILFKETLGEKNES